MRLLELRSEVTQELRSIYPPTRLSPDIQANIAFSSLPEGEMPTAGAHMYSWTIPIPQKEKSEDEGVAKDAVPDVDGNLYGVVYFVQEKVRSQKIERYCHGS